MHFAQVVFVRADVSLPSSHPLVLHHPNFLGHLRNQPEVVAHQHQASIPLCTTVTSVLVSLKYICLPDHWRQQTSLH